MRQEIRRFAFESVLPAARRFKKDRSELEVIPNATLKLAKQLDADHADFGESAKAYYSVFVSPENQNLDRMEAFFGLSQQLINLGRLSDAKSFMESSEYSRLVRAIAIDNPIKSVYFRAQAYEKMGRIADNEGNYAESRQLFSQAQIAISGIPLGDKEREVYSTAIHFQGRAHFGLAKETEGSLSRDHANQAVRYFKEHLEIKGLAEDEIAYGHGWLARCFMMKGEQANAVSEINEAKTYFNFYLESHPDRTDVLAKLDLLIGEWKFRDGSFDAARSSFNEALLNDKSDSKARSAALYGLAGVDWAQRRYGSALANGLNALKTYPLSIIKPSL